MVKVKVYSTPACPWCVRAKEWFKENNVPFEEVDVANDRAAAEEMIKKSGQTGVPVIDIDGKIIVGFNLPEIEKALEKIKKKK